MKKIKDTVYIAWAIFYMVLVIGVPVYQIHCHCIDSYKVSLLVSPEACSTSPHENHCHHDADQHQHHADCNTPQTPCDHGSLVYLQLNEHQEITSSTLSVTPKTIDIPFLWMQILADFNLPSSPRLVSDLFPDNNNYIPITVQLPGCQYLHFICQLKVPLIA
jgi:hypothetical protein